MPDTSDMDLVRAYAHRNSESAFAELVRRHINLVYSVALRYVSQAQDAEDITQAVFIILAHKAAVLRDKTVLTGWLYETTRFTSMKFLRTTGRRQIHEREACEQSSLADSGPDAAWYHIAPLLEEAMTRLSEKDRTLLALRFFENKNGAETAAILGIQEWAARKRTERAVEKLRLFFARRGIKVSAGGLLQAISANSVQAAPAALAKSVAALAVAKGATASGSTLTLIKGALKLMAWTKAKTAIVVGAVAILATGTSTMVVKKVESAHANSVFEQIWEHPDSSTMQTLIDAPSALVVRPTRYPKRPGQGYWTDARVGRGVWVNATVSELVNFAYHLPPSRTVVPSNLPAGGFDLMETLPRGENDAALQREIQKQFGLVGHKQIRETDAYKLRIRNAGLLKTHASPGGQPNAYGTGGNGSMSFVFKNQPLSEVASRLEGYFDRPVIEPDGLPGHYDFTFQIAYNLKGDALRQSLRDQLNQFGLELAPSRQSIEMLVVEHAK